MLYFKGNITGKSSANEITVDFLSSNCHSGSPVFYLNQNYESDQDKIDCIGILKSVKAANYEGNLPN